VTDTERPHSARAAHEGVIFDLDGVITDTASVHARAWKALFDEQLPRLSATLRPGTPAPPFDVGADYRRYVDGRPREDGIRAFLASRNLEPPAPEIAALAARKQAIFERLIVGGVSAFPGTVALLYRLRGRGIATAVVTSSRNGLAVLAAAGLTGIWDVRHHPAPPAARRRGHPDQGQGRGAGSDPATRGGQGLRARNGTPVASGKLNG